MPELIKPKQEGNPTVLGWEQNISIGWEVGICWGWDIPETKVNHFQAYIVKE